MRTAIVYDSCLGTTRTYARWLREALEADLFKASSGKARIDDYDLVIICCPVYMGRIKLLGYLKERWSVLQSRKIVMIVVGIFPPEHPESQKSYGRIPDDIRDRIQYFKLPGKVGPLGKSKVKQANLQPVIECIRNIF